MIKGIGTDICHVGRIREAMAKSARLAERILGPGEERREDARFLARRWAMKEAVAKAMGTGIGEALGWHDMVITHGEKGNPLCVVKGFERDRIWLSVSDDHDCAVAFAVWEGAGVCDAQTTKTARQTREAIAKSRGSGHNNQQRK